MSTCRSLVGGRVSQASYSETFRRTRGMPVRPNLDPVQCGAVPPDKTQQPFTSHIGRRVAVRDDLCSQVR